MIVNKMGVRLELKDINDYMPKIPGLRWGAVTNLKPTNTNLEMLNTMMPHDKKWHTIFETPDFIHVDKVPIKKKDLDSMT